MAHENSTKYKILVGSVAIENLTEVSFEVNNKLIDVTSKDSAGWEEFLAGLKGASFSGSLICDDSATLGASEILTALIAGTVGSFEISTNTTGTENYTFSAIYDKFTKSGGVEDKIMVSFSGKITGAVTQGTEA